MKLRHGDYISYPYPGEDFARITTKNGHLILSWNGKEVIMKPLNTKGKDLTVSHGSLGEMTSAVLPVLDRYAACQLGMALGLVLGSLGSPRGPHAR